MKWIPFVVVSSSLAACQPAPVAVSGPSGQTISRAKCSQSPNACFSQAAAACGGGSYQVLASESHAGGLIADVLPGPVTWYSMSYQCGPSDGRLPAFPFGGATMADVMATMPAPAPTPVRPITTTNCNTVGNSVSCTSY
jgi:hypothetical protein